jgi:hypothetical protein
MTTLLYIFIDTSDCTLLYKSIPVASAFSESIARHAGLQSAMTMIMFEAAADNAIAERS